MTKQVDNWGFVYRSIHSKVKVSNKSIFIIKLSIAAPQCLKSIWKMRGNGLRSKTHEHAFVQAPARLRANVPSCRLRAASYVLRRGVAGVQGGLPPCFAFLLQAFSFSNKKKMPKRGKCKIFDCCVTRR